MSITQLVTVPVAAVRLRRRDGSLAGTVVIPQDQATTAMNRPSS